MAHKQKKCPGEKMRKNKMEILRVESKSRNKFITTLTMLKPVCRSNLPVSLSSLSHCKRHLNCSRLFGLSAQSLRSANNDEKSGTARTATTTRNSNTIDSAQHRFQTKTICSGGKVFFFRAFHSSSDYRALRIGYTIYIFASRAIKILEIL